MKQVGNFIVVEKLAESDTAVLYKGFAPLERIHVVIKTRKSDAPEVVSSSEHNPCAAGKLGGEGSLKYIGVENSESGAPCLVLKFKKLESWDGILCDICYPIKTISQADSNKSLPSADSGSLKQPVETGIPNAQIEKPKSLPDTPRSPTTPASPSAPKPLGNETIFAMALPEYLTETRMTKALGLTLIKKLSQVEKQRLKRADSSGKKKYSLQRIVIAVLVGILIALLLL